MVCTAVRRVTLPQHVAISQIATGGRRGTLPYQGWVQICGPPRTSVPTNAKVLPKPFLQFRKLQTKKANRAACKISGEIIIRFATML